MGLISGLKDWIAPAALAESDVRAIERVVDCTDRRLRAMGDYQRKLAPFVRQAAAYCDGLVAAIPGPIDIDVRAFGKDPLVHAFFAAPDDIGRMLGSSREVREFVTASERECNGVFFALIGMRRKEKIVDGLVLQGGLIGEGMPQRLLYFADHTLHELSHDLDETRHRLRCSLLESLAHSFAAQLETLRRERESVHTAWEQQRAQGRSPAATAAAEALVEELREIDAALEPGHVLDALCAWLADPAARLHLVPTSVTVDRLGVVSEHGEDEADVATLSFPELVGRDRRRWILLLARISCHAAVLARQRSLEAQRYLVV